MITDVLINKKLNPIVTELFIRGRKLIFFLLHDLISLSQEMYSWGYWDNFTQTKIIQR